MEEGSPLHRPAGPDGVAAGRALPSPRSQERIVVVKDYGVRGRLGRAEPPLKGRIGLKGAVAVEVVRRDVKDHGHGRSEGRDPFELEGGDLGHHEVGLGRLLEEPRHGKPDVASNHGAQAGGPGHLADEGRGGGLPVGAGDGYPRR